MTSSQFDYKKYQLAVSIYDYAERIVTNPGDKMNLDYLRKEAAAALDTCRKELVNWSPEASTCKGKKLAGRTTVKVSTWEDTSYGWAHYTENANRIYMILLDMWKKYIHGEEIDTVLEVTQ